MRTSRGAVPSVPSSAIGRLRRGAIAAAGLLLVIGASAVGLHDVAESHLAAPESSLHA